MARNRRIPVDKRMAQARAYVAEEWEPDPGRTSEGYFRLTRGGRRLGEGLPVVLIDPAEGRGTSDQRRSRELLAFLADAPDLLVQLGQRVLDLEARLARAGVETGPPPGDTTTA